MPSKTKLKNAAIAARSAALPKISNELIDQFVTGPMTGEAVNAASMAFKKALIERAMGAELGHHLGYPAGASKPDAAANQRNGRTGKTVLTGEGPVRIDVPRDRDGSFEPRIVAKRQRRLSDLDTLVISLYSKGLTTGEISAHLLEVYGANVSKDTVSRITDKIVDDMTSWSARPLEAWRFPVIVANPDWKGFRADDSNSSDHRCGTLTECDFSRVPDATSAQRSPGPDPSPRVGSA